jgi:hypothetical protein
MGFISRLMFPGHIKLSRLYTDAYPSAFMHLAFDYRTFTHYVYVLIYLSFGGFGYIVIVFFFVLYVFILWSSGNGFFETFRGVKYVIGDSTKRACRGIIDIVQKYKSSGIPSQSKSHVEKLVMQYKIRVV